MRAVARDTDSFDAPSKESQTASASALRPRVMRVTEQKVASGPDFELDLRACIPCRRRGERKLWKLGDLKLGKCPDCYAAWTKRMSEQERSQALRLLACAEATGSEACSEYGAFLMEGADSWHNDAPITAPSSDPRWHRQSEANEHLHAWEASSG